MKEPLMAEDRNSTSPKGTNDKSAMDWDKKPGQDQEVAEKIEGDQNAQEKERVGDGQMGAPMERGQGGSGNDREGADDRAQSTDR